MSIRVIMPPAPIVKPSDLSGGYSDDDASLKSLIAAVTEEIDGPTGWLGRALGPQTLELTISSVCGRCIDLLCPPVIGQVTVNYLDRDNEEQTVDAANYRLVDRSIWLNHGFNFPATAHEVDAIRIRYRAGYNGTTGAGAGEIQTGQIPERAREAIILSAQHLKSISVENLYVREIDIPDVETMQFTLSDMASKIIEQTCDRLLSGLRLYS